MQIQLVLVKPITRTMYSLWRKFPICYNGHTRQLTFPLKKLRYIYSNTFMSRWVLYVKPLVSHNTVSFTFLIKLIFFCLSFCNLPVTDTSSICIRTMWYKATWWASPTSYLTVEWFLYKLHATFCVAELTGRCIGISVQSTMTLVEG